MKRRFTIAVAALVALLLISFSSFAQQQKLKKWHAASLDGTSGLFKTWDADSLRQGEVNFSFSYDRVQRDPSMLTIDRFRVGGAVGIVDRFEFFGGVTLQKRVWADNITTYRRGQGDAPYPAETPTGATYFSQAAPFMDVHYGSEISDINMGLKYSIMSEDLGDSASVALSGFATIPTKKDEVILSRGITSGAYKYGFALLFSKTAADFVRLHFNVGPNFTSAPHVEDGLLDPEDVGVKDKILQHELIYRFGGEFPASKPYRFIAEASGIKYFGNTDYCFDADDCLNFNDFRNPRSPLDLIFGMRFYPSRWATLGAGYQMSVNHITESPSIDARKSGYSGFVFQGTVGMRRNDPPVVSCAVSDATILQGDKATVRANAFDPDGDKLTYSWNASGGKVSGAEDTATFDATGVAPGRYTVTATVADKKHEESCSSEIMVAKRNVAPTASVEPSTFTVTQGESATLRCVASDANNDALTYAWSVDGQRLAATGSQITFGSEGRKPGTYKVTCEASDGEESASASSSGTVKERIIPNVLPTVTCLTTTMDVASGSSIELSAKASDPDGDKLTYNWSATGGTVTGRGATATYNAAGVKAGSYTVTAAVDDGRGGRASCTMTVNVSERISVTKEDCGFFQHGGTRVDNCAKAVLDDVAVQMKNNSSLRANVIGYTDNSPYERGRKTLGERRAKAVADYLEKQGVDSSRLTVTNGGENDPVGDNKTAAGRKLNRRVEIELTVQ